MTPTRHAVQRAALAAALLAAIPASLPLAQPAAPAGAPGRPSPAASAPATAPAAAAPATGAPARATGAPAEQRVIRVQLSPRRYTTLAAEIGAKISSLPIPEGGAFKQGQLLVAFDCSIHAAQYQKAQAALSAAQTVMRANERLDQLNSVGRMELDVSRAEVDKNRAELAAMGATLSKCRVAAPFNGRIAEQKVREQQFVQPGQAMLDILDDSALDLEFIAPSALMPRLQPGAEFKVVIDETGKTYPARIQRLGARVDPVSQSVKVTAVIEGRHPELLAGMSGRAEIPAAAPR